MKEFIKNVKVLSLQRKATENKTISYEEINEELKDYFEMKEIETLISEMKEQGVKIIRKDRDISINESSLKNETNSHTLKKKNNVGMGLLEELLEREDYNLENIERVVITMALQKTRWNKQETSRLLGIGRTTLYEKIKKYGLDL